MKDTKQQHYTKLFKKMMELLDVRRASSDDLAGTGLLCVKKIFGSSGYIEAGVQRFKYGRVSIFIHVKVPKLKGDIEKIMNTLATFVTAFTGVEVYYNGNFVRDYNNGKDYCPDTHRVIKTFNSKGYDIVAAEELAVLNGEKKISYLNIERKIDYDLAFQQL